MKMKNSPLLLVVRHMSFYQLEIPFRGFSMEIQVAKL